MRLAIAACLLLVVAAGCQHDTGRAASNPSGELATIERSGGLAPMEVSLTVFEDGRFGLIRMGGPTSFSRTGNLTPRQLQQFREQFAAARTLGDAYDNPRAADDYKYRLTHAGRTIRWSQAYNPLPAPLRELDQLLTAVLTSTAPQQ